MALTTTTLVEGKGCYTSDFAPLPTECTLDLPGCLETNCGLDTTCTLLKMFENLVIDVKKVDKDE